MKAALSSTGIAISLVSGFLVLALVAELYYLLWWKKKKRIPKSSSEEENKLYLFFCWKSPTPLNPQQIRINNSESESDSVLVDAEFMRLHSLPAPQRFLFTIKEETKEELEEFSVTTETPFMTPLSSPPFFTPPLTPMQGFNPLFESFKGDSETSRAKAFSTSYSSSPPPKFKFMRDAEEKLYRKILTEEATRVRRATSSPPPLPPADSDSDGSFVAVVIGKNRDSLPSSPSTAAAANG